MVSRVVIISDQSVARGGAEAMAITSAKLFAKHGVPVTFFCGDDGAAPDLVEAGVEIAAVGATHVLETSKLTAFKNGLYALKSRAAMEAWIAKHDDDQVIYHVHSWSKFLSPSIFAALKIVGDRCVIHGHDFFMVCPNGAFMNYPAGKLCTLKPMSLACIASNCDKRNYAEKLWRVGRQKIREHYFDLSSSPAHYALVHRGMIPLFTESGVPAARIKVISNPIEVIPAPRILAERNKVVCFVGRLDPEKGAIDAAKAARMAGIPLRVIGEGTDREELERDFPEVELTGWCSAAQVSQYLQTARLLVVPSRWRETFGMVVVEALRLGIPVIISNKALISADLVATGAGLSIDTQNIELFSDALTRLKTDDFQVETMSRNAKAAASQLALSEVQWRDSLLDYYQQILGHSPATIQ